MKKKGFTLIELLAVIVILAIIALIATPLVLKYIEKSRKESKIDSAYSFVHNLETEMANYAIKNKGSRFNKSPKNGKFYELTDFDEDKKIDTTVKGDKPNSIKVCLSSLGQVEKAMFQYGKYYVSYDGKKGSISDEDTYSNFSCGDTQIKYLFEANMEFSENSSSIVIDENIYNQIIGNHEYDIVIDDTKVMTMFAVSSDTEILFMTDDYNELIILKISKEKYQMKIDAGFELLGTHNVKISYPRETKDNTFFSINHYDDTDSGYPIVLHDTDFVEGNASILIEDEDGIIYLNQDVFLTDNHNNGLYGIDDCRNNDFSLPDLYTAIEQGKKIKITVTQNIEGTDVISVVVDDYIPKDNTEFSDYYIGRIVLDFLDGC